MDFKRRNEIGENRLPGRVVQNGVGRNSAVASEKMTVSYCTYSAESGPMAPHNHAEETVVVLDCKDAYVKYGSGPGSWYWSSYRNCHWGTTDRILPCI